MYVITLFRFRLGHCIVYICSIYYEKSNISSNTEIIGQTELQSIIQLLLILFTQRSDTEK